VEYAIALFNGSGVAKNEQEAARFLQRAARRGSAIAQNRLAHILAAGRGVPSDPVQAIKWHLISKEAGANDQNLDAFMRRQKPETIAAATKAAQPSIELIRLSREPRS
jgi:TPR repeat protein